MENSKDNFFYYYLYLGFHRRRGATYNINVYNKLNFLLIDIWLTKKMVTQRFDKLC